MPKPTMAATKTIGILSADCNRHIAGDIVMEAVSHSHVSAVCELYRANGGHVEFELATSYSQV